MEPDWIRRPLHEMELTHRPLTRSLLVLQLVQRPLARQVPPPRSGWPQFRGQAALVGGGGVGSEVAGASVGVVGGVGLEVQRASQRGSSPCRPGLRL